MGIGPLLGITSLTFMISCFQFVSSMDGKNVHQILFKHKM